MEPNVGVDYDDVSRMEGGADNSTTGPPTLRRRPEVPGLTARYLSLPGGLVLHQNTINVIRSSGVGSDEDPWPLRWSRVWLEELRKIIEMTELLGHRSLTDCPAHVPQGVPNLLHRHSVGVKTVSVT